MDSPTATTLSVIIVNWNTKDLLYRCLRSIYDTVPPTNFEIIVIDNASTDGSAEMVTSEFPGVILIRSDRNLGFSAGNNIGLALASGKYVLLLNPDAELMPNAASHMMEFADAHPDVAFVGPKLLNSDGSLQKNGRKFPSLLREMLGLMRIYRWFWRYYDLKMGWGREDFNAPAEVDEVSGACILARKSAINEVGLLDERFFMYYEETDWCHRMKKAGWKVWYIPSAEVVHHWAAGAKQLGLDGSRIFYKSQYQYFKKHHGLIKASMLRGMSTILLLALSMRERIRGAKNEGRNAYQH